MTVVSSTVHRMLVGHVPQAAVSRVLHQLSRQLSARNLKIFGKIDHSQAAREVHLELPPTVNVYFGEPDKGTHLMTQRPDLAARLPLCLSLRQERDAVRITFLHPFPDDPTLLHPARHVQDLAVELMAALGAAIGAR